ncbi:MAG: DsrE family protein [Flavobacteriia bacterium]|nr:DsrE family protein [Flavobacteriia bacterium]
MKSTQKWGLLVALIATNFLYAQELVNPVIKNFGTIGQADLATEKPDPNLTYNIVVDLATGEDNKSNLLFSLNNVARLINLHVMGGVPKENLNIVVAVHGGAIWSVLNNELYYKKFKTANPNIPLYKELLDSGVKIVVCSQSMFKRNIAPSELVKGLEVATSALTTLTTYQIKGYAVLKF